MARNSASRIGRLLELATPCVLVWRRQKKALLKEKKRSVVELLRYFRADRWRELFEPSEKDESQARAMARMLVQLDQKPVLQRWRDCFEYVDRNRAFFSLIKPYADVSRKKIRIGGNADGGYVMLEPGENGIAYSFGVSEYSPWDLAMAEKGFRVYQYDGTVDANPHPHPNITFHKFNIDGSDNPPEGSRNIRQILAELGHGGERNIILQMDIEGAEWDVLSGMDAGDLDHFSQIIVELHDLNPTSESFADKLRVLGKVSQTHVPIHVHCNNVLDGAWAIPGLPPFPPLIEVSYARRQDGRFVESTEFFPTELDHPNLPQNNEILLGTFDKL